MKRILTRIAAIIDTIIYALITATCSLLFGLILAGSSYTLELGITDKNIGITIFVGFLVLLIFIISLAGLIFSVKSISFMQLGREKFRSKFPIIIANIVFNFMFAVIIFFFSGDTAINPLHTTVLFLCFIVCGVMYIVDICKNKNIPSTLSNQKKVFDIKQELETSHFTLEINLVKLNNLKEQNLITDEEYTALREKTIKSELEK